MFKTISFLFFPNQIGRENFMHNFGKYTKYSFHWVLLPASVRGFEVAKHKVVAKVRVWV